jgi:glycosyltransferase involved in cell wall biosynthesis
MFDSAGHVAEAIESVLAQTYPAAEILVLDDGSADGSVAVAAQFGPPVRVVEREHAGQGATRNAGAELASGDVLAFLDADDVWLPHKTARQLEVLEADAGCSMVFGRVVQFFSPELEHDGDPRPLGRAEARGLLPSAMVVRTEAFRRVGGFREDVTFGDFLDWYARAQDAGLRAHTVDDVVLRRRIHATNTGVRDRSERREYVRVLKDVLDRRARGQSA